MEFHAEVKRSGCVFLAERFSYEGLALYDKVSARLAFFKVTP